MTKRKRPEDEILVAADDGTITIDEDTFYLRRGITRVRASHPMVERAPHLFKELDVHYDVEQATAAPGERRGG